MSRLLPNLVMVFAFVLCGLCVYQWKNEGQLQKSRAALNDELYEKKGHIQNLEQNARRDREEINRLDQARKELTETKLANEKKIGELTAEAERLLKVKESLETQLDRYKQAIETANERILKQNEDIKKQNEDIKKQNDLIATLAKQRDDKGAELAKVVEEYNKLVGDYNKLVEDVKKMNAAAGGGGQRK